MAPVAAAVVITVCSATFARAQTGQISGVVRDANGAVLPGVTMSVAPEVSDAIRTVTTDERGRYEVDDLPLGRLFVTATLAGFEPRTTAVEVSAGVADLDFVLSLAPFTEAISVTGTRTGTTDVERTPIAITALSGRTLEQLGIETIDGLAGPAPGVTVTPSGGGNALLSIRGIGTNSFVAGADPSSTIYLDGVYLGRPAMTAMDFLNIDRIEILRGPQGTLYGRNSVGGAIHIVTRQPTEVFEASARLTAGDYGKLRAEAATGGPVIRNKVMANIAFLRDAGDGYVNDLEHPEHSLGSEDTWAGRGQVRVLFGKRSDLLVSGDYGRFDGNPLSYAKVMLPKPGFRFDNPAGLWNVRASHLSTGNNVQYGTSAKINVQLNPTTVFHSLTAYRKSDYRYFIDPDATELPILTADVPDVQRQTSEELTVVQRRAKLTWIGGAFFFKDHNEGAVAVTTIPIAIETRLFPRIDTQANAIFGQATYSLARRVSLTGGVRYTHERKDLDNTGGIYRLGTTVLADPASFYDYVDTTASDAWTPKLGVEFQLSDDTFVYGSATRGFKSGGFNTTARAPGKHFSPEFAWSYEAGLKRTMADGRVRANAAVFYNDYRDLQVLSFSAPGVFEIGNAGAATIKGLELEAAAGGRRLQVAADVSWLSTAYDRYLARLPTGRILDAAGNRLSNAPEWSGGTSVVYQHPVGKVGIVSARADVWWQSRVFFTPANDAIENQPPYALINLRAGIEPPSRRWEVAFYVRNLANEDYVLGTASVAPTAVTSRPGEPRRWGTQLMIRR
jgi:iron complex outermembrane recepter protein